MRAACSVKAVECTTELDLFTDCICLHLVPSVGINGASTLRIETNLQGPTPPNHNH